MVITIYCQGVNKKKYIYFLDLQSKIAKWLKRQGKLYIGGMWIVNC